MFRLAAAALAAALLLASPSASLTEEETGAILEKAIAAADSEDWDGALELVGEIPDPLAREIIEWLRLRAGGSTELADYTAFLRRHPDWPATTRIHAKGEAALPDTAPPSEVLAYFRTVRPRTGIGVLRKAEALQRLGRKREARTEVIRAWRRFSLTEGERKQFLTRYGDLLRPHHVARLDMLLWRRLHDQARAMLPLVPEGRARLARARIALQQRRSKGVDALIRAIPKTLLDDPGLAYDRFEWRMRKGLYETARTLLEEVSTSAQALGKPEKWASRRRAIARREMREGNPRRAYRIATRHFLTRGADYADLEWLAGYIALRKLNDPKTALIHFARFREAVETPISLSRAGYWQGRALEKLGRKDEARQAYAFAAQYQTAFYGQLAAERIGAPPDPRLAGGSPVPDWRGAGFVSRSLFQAAVMLHYANQPARSELFFRTLARGLDETELQQLAEFTYELGRPDVTVRLSKLAARRGVILPRTYFPLIPLAQKKLPVAPEIAMAIARRESELNPETISPAGARGLMQLMPGTARKVARALGLPYDKGRLTADWSYNATLGAAYLARQIEDFGGSYILAFAAYNAGPSRARRWIDEIGDPRGGRMDPVDWIEHIPFRETRNYVMRVAESLLVYRARLKGRTPRLRLSKDLRRGRPEG